MEINKQILSKYYGKAAVEQLVQQYSLEGYEILHQKEIDGIQTDLIVKKGDETIIFEVKAGDWNFQRRNQIKKLRHGSVGIRKTGCIPLGNETHTLLLAIRVQADAPLCTGYFAHEIFPCAAL